MKNKILPTALATVALNILLITQADAADYPDVNGDAAAVLDVNNDQILYNDNANQVFETASTAKLMTAYLLLEEIESGDASWGDYVSVYDQGIIDLSNDPEWGTLKLEYGDKLTVQQLYEFMMIPSSNESAQLLGRYIAGSDLNYMNLANQTAKEIGMTKTNFVNASGVDWDALQDYQAIKNTPYLNNTSTATDLAILGARLIQEFPQIIDLTKQYQTNLSWDGRRYTSFIWNLPGERYDNGLVTIDGLKTGYTTGAGNVYVNTALENGHRLVSVIMHDMGSGEIGQDQEKLLRAAFDELNGDNQHSTWPDNTAVIDVEIQDEFGNVVRTERVYFPVSSSNQKIGLEEILLQLGLDPDAYELVSSTTSLVN